MSELPPCGLYRTTAAIGNIEAGRLVYFHNHGDPGPGLYFPEQWSHNRARFSEKGMPVPASVDGAALGRALRALPPEGFYRVASGFHCCAKQCMRFEPESLVQLGYNGAGRALLFVPEFAGGVLGVPERGTMIDDSVLVHLVAMRVNERRDEIAMPRGLVIH